MTRFFKGFVLLFQAQIKLDLLAGNILLLTPTVTMFLNVLILLMC